MKLLISQTAANLRIAAGLHSQTNFSGYEQYSLVDSFIMHPQYDTITLENDLVLLKVHFHAKYIC